MTKFEKLCEEMGFFLAKIECVQLERLRSFREAPGRQYKFAIALQMEPESRFNN